MTSRRAVRPPSPEGGPRWPGVLLCCTGVSHVALGAVRWRAELRRRPRRLTDAPLWFLTTGFALTLLGADLAAVPGAVASSARRLRGAGLVVIGLGILSQRRRSGAWALLPIGAAVALARGRDSAPTSGRTILPAADRVRAERLRAG